MAKKKEDVKQQEAGTVTVSREEFKQTRDNFLSSFAVVEQAIRDLTSSYIRHTNTVLGNENSSVESVIRDLGEAAGNAATLAARSISPAKSEADKKKERKKRVHDPNAPKRPLTPYFLYMQTARPIITSDLGPDAAKGAVSDEGTRRWSVMAQPDRESWSNAYKDNLKLYNARMHSYKAGNLAAKTMTDEEARIYYDEHLAQAGDHSADAQLVNEALANSPDAEIDADVEVEADAEEEVESEEEEAPVVVRTPTPPPPKTPKVKASRKKAAPKTETPVVAPVAAPTVAATPASEPEKPEKKRKRKSKAELEKEKANADAPVDSIESEELLVQTPAPPKSSKPKKKKAKASD